MDKIIDIRNINFGYENKPIFKDFSFFVKKGDFVTIIGQNGSGKSTLLRAIVGLINVNGLVYVDDIELNNANLKKIRSRIGVVFENPDNQFVAETVMDDIAFSLENKMVKPKEIRKKVREISEYLEISHLLEKEPHILSGGEKQLVALASALVGEPAILILDEAFTMVDNEVKEKIYKILIDINKKGVTIINVTHDIDESLYGNSIAIIEDGAIVIKGDKEKVLLEEKLFKKLGFDLPFMVDLSIKLKYYGLLDKIIYDMDEMVDIIWK